MSALGRKWPPTRAGRFDHPRVRVRPIADILALAFGFRACRPVRSKVCGASLLLGDLALAGFSVDIDWRRPACRTCGFQRVLQTRSIVQRLAMAPLANPSRANRAAPALIGVSKWIAA